jgi:hypothetical protein
MAITGRGTSTTASSWAWAHGLVGATATAGADIASPRTVAETITAAAAGLLIAAIMHVAAAKQAGHVPALVTVKRSIRVLLAQTRLQLPVHRLRTRHRLRTQHRLHTQLLVAAAVVDIKAGAAVSRTVVVADMKAADINL